MPISVGIKKKVFYLGADPANYLPAILGVREDLKKGTKADVYFHTSYSLVELKDGSSVIREKSRKCISILWIVDRYIFPLGVSMYGSSFYVHPTHKIGSTYFFETNQEHENLVFEFGPLDKCVKNEYRGNVSFMNEKGIIMEENRMTKVYLIHIGNMEYKPIAVEIK